MWFARRILDSLSNILIQRAKAKKSTRFIEDSATTIKDRTTKKVWDVRGTYQHRKKVISWVAKIKKKEKYAT